MSSKDEKSQEKKNDDAMELIQGIAKELEIKREVDGVQYRQDYQDYRFIFTDKTHCEIREKLIDICLYDAGTIVLDARKEIAFRIKQAVEFEEWEQ
jgi:hypothetical protein